MKTYSLKSFDGNTNVQNITMGLMGVKENMFIKPNFDSVETVFTDGLVNGELLKCVEGFPNLKRIYVGRVQEPGDHLNALQRRGVEVIWKGGLRNLISETTEVYLPNGKVFEVGNFTPVLESDLFDDQALVLEGLGEHLLEENMRAEVLHFHSGLCLNVGYEKIAGDVQYLELDSVNRFMESLDFARFTKVRELVLFKTSYPVDCGTLPASLSTLTVNTSVLTNIGALAHHPNLSTLKVIGEDFRLFNKICNEVKGEMFDLIFELDR